MEIFLLIWIGLGSAWGPVEFGYTMARAQCWRNILCFLLAGHYPPAWTSSTSEICTGRAGHEQVRGKTTETSPAESTFWCLQKSLAVNYILPILLCLSLYCVHIHKNVEFFCRDDVLQSLTIVQHCLLGAGGLMPPLKGEPIPELWALTLTP